jgi:hypothetical protein
MRTTVDLPDNLLRKVKIQARQDGVSLKNWFIARLSADVEKRNAHPPRDEASRFRARFKGDFEPGEIDQFKRAGRM